MEILLLAEYHINRKRSVCSIKYETISKLFIAHSNLRQIFLYTSFLRTYIFPFNRNSIDRSHTSAQTRELDFVLVRIHQTTVYSNVDR